MPDHNRNNESRFSFVVKAAAPGLLAICALFSSQAAASLSDDINALRGKGCAGRPGVKAKLQSSKDLDAVAREWSRGGRLRDALARADYRAVSSASMHVEGAPNDAALLKVLKDNYCDTITDATYTTIGMYRGRQEVHIVVAQPFSAPSARDAPAISNRILTLVNSARAKPRKCGRTAFPAAPALILSSTLGNAALTHARDMAAHEFLEHKGSDGSTPAERATRAGYQWRNIAENIAAGATTAESVMQGWLESPGHCANIMSPQYTEMGVSYVTDPDSQAGIYWAQVFGRR